MCFNNGLLVLCPVSCPLASPFTALVKHEYLGRPCIECLIAKCSPSVSLVPLQTSIEDPLKAFIHSHHSAGIITIGGDDNYNDHAFFF